LSKEPYQLSKIFTVPELTLNENRSERIIRQGKSRRRRRRRRREEVTSKR
jgi:hypothetical protein